MPAAYLGFEEDRTVNIKVALLTHVLTPHRLPLLENVARRFRNMRVFVSSPWDEPHKFSLSRGGLDVTVQRSLNWAHRFRNHHGYSDVSYINLPYDTWQQLRRYCPDVIVTTECGMRSVLSALYRIACPEVTLIVWAHVTEHTEVTRGLLRRAVRHFILRHTDVVFVNGRSGEAYIRGLGYSGPTATVPYTISPDLFESGEYAPRPDVRRLLFTGQLIERKGLRVFCQVLCRWCADHPSSRVVFRIVGDGPERGFLEALTTPPNLVLELFSATTQEKLAEHYEQADIYAFPSLGDEWGVVVNEAMIAGLPVLGSSCSGATDELVLEGSNGWLFSPYDEQDVYKAVHRALATGTTELCAMSQRAKETIAAIAPPLVAATVVNAIARACKSSRPMEGGMPLRENEEFASERSNAPLLQLPEA